MIIKPAQIDSSGIERILQFAETPSTVALDNVSIDQQYVPGIYVPGIAILEEPFNVPVVGDNESVSLAIDWPQKDGVDLVKRISFIGMLTAEEVTRGEPVDEDAMDDHTFLTSLLSDSKFKDVDDAFDDYTGEWGGFLRATVEVRHCTIGTAEFIIMESQSEFDMIHALLETGEVSAAEIVSVIRLSKIAPQIGLQTLSE